MKIEKLFLKNIRSYREEEIVFPLGSTLLSGDVGAGKTTVLLALEYALFGLQPRQRGASLLSNGEQEGRVTLHIEIEGHQVVIERSLKRGSRSVAQEYSSLAIDGQKQELAVTELKSRILTLLGYPEEFVKKTNLLYRYTVYSPQEEMKQIILEDAESRLDILRHVFGIDKYRMVKDNISLVTTRLRERARVSQGEMSGLEENKTKLEECEVLLEATAKKIESAQERVTLSKASRNRLETELKELEEQSKEKQRIEKEVDKTNMLLISKVQTVAEHEREMQKLHEKISEVRVLFDEKEYSRVISLITLKKNILEELQTQSITFSSKIHLLFTKKEDELEKRKRIFSIDMCPTCLQDVPDSHKHNILNDTEKNVAQVDLEISRIRAEESKINATITSERSILASLEKDKMNMEVLRITTNEIVPARSRLNEISKMREATKKDIAVLEEHLISLKQTARELLRFNKFIEDKQAEVKNSFLEEKKSEVAFAELRKEREFLMKETTRINNDLKKKEEARSKLMYLSSLEAWLSQDFVELVSFIERNIMLKVREEFSKLFNKWFNMLTTDAFYVQLDENFTPVITQGDYELDYDFLSGGERTAIALAYRLSLNQIVNSLYSKIKTRDLIILDEPTDGFSDQQLDRVRDILRELHVLQLIIVSHEPKIESFVDNVLRIKKDSGYSTQG